MPQRWRFWSQNFQGSIQQLNRDCDRIKDVIKDIQKPERKEPKLKTSEFEGLRPDYLSGFPIKTDNDKEYEKLSGDL